MKNFSSYPSFSAASQPSTPSRYPPTPTRHHLRDIEQEDADTAQRDDQGWAERGEAGLGKGEESLARITLIFSLHYKVWSEGGGDWG